MTFHPDLAFLRFAEWALHDLGFLYQKRHAFVTLIWLFQEAECMTWALYLDKSHAFWVVRKLSQGLKGLQNT